MADNVRHPAPINQFYRLEYDEVHKVWVKKTRWGTRFDSANCMASEGAVALDAHTGGRLRSSPPQIRSLQTDQSGGIGVDDVSDAWQRLGHSLTVPNAFNWWDTLAAVRDRRHALIGVVYSAMPSQFRLQLPGTFDHALGIDDYRTSDGALLVYDSLGTKARWLPQYAVRGSAEALARKVRGTPERLFVGLTAVRPPLTSAAPTYRASVARATSLWNPMTKRWVYVGANKIKAGTDFRVRGARYVMDGVSCYPVVTRYSGYYVPAANMRLGAVV